MVLVRHAGRDATGARCDGETEIEMYAAVIEQGSEAFQYLRAVMADPRMYRISLEIRPDGIAVKENEFTWTPTMDIAKR